MMGKGKHFGWWPLLDFEKFVNSKVTGNSSLSKNDPESMARSIVGRVKLVLMLILLTSETVEGLFCRK